MCNPGEEGVLFFSIANFLDEYTFFLSAVQAPEKSYKVITWSSEPHQTKDIKKILITNCSYLLLILLYYLFIFLYIYFEYTIVYIIIGTVWT